jgi:hypothetical protein
MTIELKIKNKYLSEEARIIRFEEKKLKKQTRYAINKHIESGANEPFEYYKTKSYKDYQSLNAHRRYDVRNENRATYLARAFIEGVSYNQVEASRKEEKEYMFLQIILPRVLTMINKYGREWDPVTRIRPPEFTKEQLMEWIND